MILYDTRITSTFSGACGSNSYQLSRDGAQARYSRPFDVIQDRLNPKRLIVSEYRGNALRAIDRDTRIASTIARYIVYPRFMTQATSGDIYLTAGNGIYKYNYKLSITELVAGSSTNQGYFDVGLDSSRFYDPYGLIQLEGIDLNTFVVADRGNNHVRVEDITQNRTMTLNLCRYGAYKFQSWGLLSVCNLSSPEYMLLSGSTLYLAESKGIKKFEG